MRLNSQIPSNLPQPLAQPAPKKRLAWGKCFYLLVIVVAFAGIGKWGFGRFCYIKSPGILSGVEVKVEAPIKAVVQSLPLAIGDTVKRDEPLVVLYDVQLQEEIAQQEAQIKHLQAEELKEKRQLSVLLEEQDTQLMLAKNRAQGKEEDLIGQIEVLSLEEKSLQQRGEQLGELFRHSEKLYQLEATPLPKFLETKILLDENKVKLEAVAAKLATARKKLSKLRAEIQMLDKESLQLPQKIGRKSSLPVLAVKIESAAQRLALLKKSLQERTLRSPLVGVVTQIFKKPKEVVLPGEALLSIVDPGSTFIKAYFPQKEEAHLHPRQRVRLLFDNGQQKQGVIRKFYPCVGPLPVQFQEYFQPRQHALVAEIVPLGNSVWPLTLGMGVQVQKKRVF